MPVYLRLSLASAVIFCCLAVNGDEIPNLLQCLYLKMAILYFQPAELLCSRAVHLSKKLIGNFKNPAQFVTCGKTGKFLVDPGAITNGKVQARHSVVLGRCCCYKVLQIFVDISCPCIAHAFVVRGVKQQKALLILLWYWLLCQEASVVNGRLEIKAVFLVFGSLQ